MAITPVNDAVFPAVRDGRVDVGGSENVGGGMAGGGVTEAEARGLVDARRTPVGPTTGPVGPVGPVGPTTGPVGTVGTYMFDRRL